jgi:hypothetical protein
LKYDRILTVKEDSTMIITEIIFWIWLIMSGVYVVFRIRDFGYFWWKVITVIPKKIWEMINRWIGRK